MADNDFEELVWENNQPVVRRGRSESAKSSSPPANSTGGVLERENKESKGKSIINDDIDPWVNKPMEETDFCSNFFGELNSAPSTSPKTRRGLDLYEALLHLRMQRRAAAVSLEQRSGAMMNFAHFTRPINRVTESIQRIAAAKSNPMNSAELPVSPVVSSSSSASSKAQVLACGDHQQEGKKRSPEHGVQETGHVATRKYKVESIWKINVERAITKATGHNGDSFP